MAKNVASQGGVPKASTLAVFRPKVKPPRIGSRTLLERASADAERILAADPQLERLCHDYMAILERTDEDAPVNGFDALSDTRNEIRWLAQRILVDALRRQGARHIKVEVNFAVSGGKTLHMILTLKNRASDREVSKYLEIAL